MDCFSRLWSPRAPGAQTVGLVGAGGMLASGTCGTGHGRRLTPCPRTVEPGVLRGSGIAPPWGTQQPTDLLKLSGLVVLGALQEVEQDDIAQHRALGGSSNGKGAAGCPLTPHRPPEIRLPSPFPPPCLVAVGFPSIHPPSHPFWASPRPSALRLWVTCFAPGLRTASTHHANRGEGSHRVDEGGHNAEFPSLREGRGLSRHGLRLWHP